ncbi:MAG: twin-arginine translocase TatA/TatE family subunit [Dehalococcoidales bacterium]|nr:twin-arginine translocase TatA/TatE family subunit [Dehalococcoidales bacterium]
MPRLGPMEIGLILVIVLIVFGVGRLPQIGGAIGKSISEFRKSSRDDTETDKKTAVAPTAAEVKK